MSTPLEEIFVKTRLENRAAFIAYIPAGFPSIEGCKRVIEVLAQSGVDALEIGFPYSDPVMDGPTIQEAAGIALEAGTGSSEVFETVKYAHDAGLATVVMTYWNPIEKYGVEAFAREMANNGGSGVVTPDLTIEESAQWKAATNAFGVNTIYVVAPSTKGERLAQVTAQCSGFVYAASLMGVTGARSTISSGAHDLVTRIRATTSMPIAVGLGVSTREQARDVAGFADGVIVGSAFIKIILEAKDENSALREVKNLAQDLAAGVREGR
ncbi:MAG: tryptophan synthase subunit alpha [Actinobacteria bacterium]|uniref:tryptophan synthase n=1 Tax=freshwater metagenome TaxID=449393 RepID=A0A6J7M7G8_9ZZZZ|nr:tryptophan synthase subunit alpha [Actinomycetota bacterium]MSY09724.1 tryptophan synthase subunit alpha [Actinomycetota bacterium]MSZ68298.1 tryptophan synthase subunit alpha [Actinomycetota bacterium]MTB15494.1 tryptophan synthase subunit alpha [Actinomycetota bacterium]